MEISLHNPRYAGAFVYGRSRIACNAQLRPVQRDVKQQDWKVLIRDAHAGYILACTSFRRELDAEPIRT